MFFIVFCGWQSGVFATFPTWSAVLAYQGNQSLFIIFLDSTRGDLSYSDSPCFFFIFFHHQNTMRRLNKLPQQDEPVSEHVRT